MRLISLIIIILLLQSCTVREIHYFESKSDNDFFEVSCEFLEKLVMSTQLEKIKNKKLITKKDDYELYSVCFSSKTVLFLVEKSNIKVSLCKEEVEI